MSGFDLAYRVKACMIRCHQNNANESSIHENIWINQMTRHYLFRQMTHNPSFQSLTADKIRVLSDTVQMITVYLDHNIVDGS